MTLHLFRGSLSEGEILEVVLDGVYYDGFEAETVSRDEQRKGRDRVFRNRLTGQLTPVEYKADKRAAETLNAFFEITSIDYANKDKWTYDRRDREGWVYTCKSAALLVYIPPCGLILIYKPRNLKHLIEGWKTKYPIRPAINEGYKTWGVCVPIEVAAEAAYKIQRIKPETITLADVAAIVSRLKAGRKRVA